MCSSTAARPYEIGPLYTASLLPDLATKRYPTLADVPGFDALYPDDGPPAAEASVGSVRPAGIAVAHR